MKNYIPCVVCAKKATWSYMPSKGEYCDAHVPRGCSCNHELNQGIAIDSKEAEDAANYHEVLDDKGRKMPCCEFSSIRDEWHDDPEVVWNGWEDYYEEHPDDRPADEYEEPPIRKRTRRDRLIDAMPDQKLARKNRARMKEHQSKPKGWKHRR